ncbi:MAG: two-component sensor histidine kinase, partial [bacterium]|nr:two-component sensor histidine kinase [Candidatus Kapabacteria bacterium]
HHLSKHTLEIHATPDLPVVHADFVLIGQVFVNLLDNAAKYSPVGSTIVARTQLEEKFVAVAIEDEGIGIPSGDLERVFDKFYRVQQSDTRTAGTGLGLSICRGIIQEHSGSIAAESPIVGDHGTRMTVRLPIADNVPSFDQSMVEL